MLVDIDSFGSFVGTIDSSDNMLISTVGDGGVEKKITVETFEGGLDLSGTNTGDKSLVHLGCGSDVTFNHITTGDISSSGNFIGKNISLSNVTLRYKH